MIASNQASLLKQTRQILLDVLHHRVRPLVHLQPLRQGESLEVWDDFFGDGDDLGCLLGGPHGGSELLPVRLMVWRVRLKGHTRTLG